MLKDYEHELIAFVETMMEFVRYGSTLQREANPALYDELKQVAASGYRVYGVLHDPSNAWGHFLRRRFPTGRLLLHLRAFQSLRLLAGNENLNSMDESDFAALVRPARVLGAAWFEVFPDHSGL